jgi:ABC-type Mn2+/Zn2+ transport system permease subunit
MTSGGASTLMVAVGMATAAGLVGCFAVMRRMALASDAISHVALPGIGLALALRLHPLLGGIAALLVGTVLIWALENRTRLPVDTVTGVVFSAALALGAMLTSGESLIEALLGSSGALSLLEAVFGLSAAAAIVVFILRARHRLVVALVSADLARTTGVDVAGLDLLYLLAFAVTVALGLRYLGVLLMGSLIIIPAATARHLAKNLTAMLAIAVAVAVLSTVLGIVTAARLHRESGPVIILIAATVFFLALLKRQ